MASTSTADEDLDEDMIKKRSTSLMSRMEINDNKAGMEGLNKEKINQIIYESSKGSKFYENERKKEEQLDLKIQKLKSYACQISSQSLNEGNVQADLLLEKLKLERDLSHDIVHMDMDAFYAAVEMRDDPSLKSKPMAVGGMGMLSTSNYLARKFGVRAAMPGFIGLKLCPDLVIVKPNFDKYTTVSHEIRKVLALYNPTFCPMSLDEAYLDFGQHLENRKSSLASERTFILRENCELNSNDIIQAQSGVPASICDCDLNSVLLPSILNSDVFLSLVGDEVEFQSYVDNFDSGCLNEGIPTMCALCEKMFPRYRLKVYGLTIEDAVLEMRNRIEQHTRLTASAGIAPNMMLAKICSDKNKPNGQYRILPDVSEIEKFVQDLPIRKVSGIGKVTEKLLGGLDVVKCSDIYDKRSLLYHLFSTTSFDHFLSISLGIGSTTVERDDERKSISTEETFSEISDETELCRKCEEMCVAVSNDMKQENIKGKTVTLKLKTVSFDIKTRSQTLQDFTNDPSTIMNAAKKLLLTEIRNSQPAPLRLRLMGVRMSKLISSNNEQVTVSTMFKKYKEKGSTSTKNQSQICTNNFIYGSEKESIVPEEGEEDFSRPVTETALYQRETKANTLSPTKAKKETKKSETSSGNILNFFMRQKEMKVKKKDHLGNLEIDNSEKNTQKVFICKDNPEGTSEYLMEENPRIKIDLDNEIAYSSSQACSKDTVFKTSSMSCPICGLREPKWNLQSLNNHIDACLSHQTIQNILQDERIETQGSKRSRSDEQAEEVRRPGKIKKTQRSVLSYFQP